MSDKLDFDQLPNLSDSFHELTLPIGLTSNNPQVENMMAVLGMSHRDMAILQAVAESYLEPEDALYSSGLTSMFALGFFLALYASKEEELSGDCID